MILTLGMSYYIASYVLGVCVESCKNLSLYCLMLLIDLYLELLRNICAEMRVQRPLKPVYDKSQMACLMHIPV